MRIRNKASMAKVMRGRSEQEVGARIMSALVRKLRFTPSVMKIHWKVLSCEVTGSDLWLRRIIRAAAWMMDPEGQKRRQGELSKER